MPRLHCREAYRPVKTLIMSLIVKGQMGEPRLDLQRVFERKVVSTLQRVLALNVIHDDMRRENIMIQDFPPRVWIIDFGRAHIDNSEEAKSSAISDALSSMESAWEFYDWVHEQNKKRRN